MSRSDGFGGRRSGALRTYAGLRLALQRVPPARAVLGGYVLWVLFGWLLLSLPGARAAPGAALDDLFIAASAVSTTGLVSVDPGSTYSLFGEAVILLLIQVGGVGYMTVGSLAALALHHRLSGARVRMVRFAFSLPPDFSPAAFVRAVVLFTLICEAVGAAILYPLLLEAGVDRPLWSAIFHAVSAFCTAGFSLNPDSFESLRADVGVTLTLSTLSVLGATGFLIVVDAWRTAAGRRRHLGFTSKVIARMTLGLLAVGTAFLFLAEPALRALPPEERLLAAFFQTMTATTTVGFNTVPIGALSTAGLLALIFLMAIGASPAGTGGGLKTTTFAALLGLVRSTLRGRETVRFAGRDIPPARVQAATAAFAYYAGLLLAATALLALTEADEPLEPLLFEAASALGTVGLSMGVTGGLSELGKLIVIVLMVAGRVGILTFGVALAAREEGPEEARDGELVV